MDDEADQFVDVALVLSLLRGMLPVGSASEHDGQTEAASATQREEAGSAVWDLSSSKIYAAAMLDNKLPQILEAVLLDQLQNQDSDPRMVEICVGILGNVATHADLAERVARLDGLLNIVLEACLWLNDAPALIQTCRLVGIMLQPGVFSIWRDKIHQDVVVQRLLWICANTLSSPLQEQVVPVVAQLLSTDRSCGELMLQNGLLQTLQELMDSYLKRLSSLTAGSGWDDASPMVSTPTAGSIAAPTDSVAAAALRVLEELGEDEKLRRAVEGKPSLIEGLLELLEDAESSPVLEQLLMVMTRYSRVPELLVHRVPLLGNILSVLFEADDNEDVIDAGWYLLAAATQALAVQTDVDPQIPAAKVVEVLPRLLEAPLAPTSLQYAGATAKNLIVVLQRRAERPTARSRHPSHPVEAESSTEGDVPVSHVWVAKLEKWQAHLQTLQLEHADHTESCMAD